MAGRTESSVAKTPASATQLERSGLSTPPALASQLVNHALFLPPAGELADPATLIEIAVTAERSGWDGLFLWDHVLRPATEPQEILDPWIMMAAIATATTSIRLGPMVTPLTRRRPIKIAREAVTLDHLSRGRLTLGLGLGVDTYGELSKFGDVADPRIRGQRLDEGAELLVRMWSGEVVDFHGEHHMADNVIVLPRPFQQPRIPLWFAARGDARRPVRRAARYEGLFPVDVDPDGLRTMLDVVRTERGSLDGFDVAIKFEGASHLETCQELGATWVLHTYRGNVDAAAVLDMAGADPVVVSNSSP